MVLVMVGGVRSRRIVDCEHLSDAAARLLGDRVGARSGWYTDGVDRADTRCRGQLLLQRGRNAGQLCDRVAAGLCNVGVRALGEQTGRFGSGEQGRLQDVVGHQRCRDSERVDRTIAIERVALAAEWTEGEVVGINPDIRRYQYRVSGVVDQRDEAPLISARGERLGKEEVRPRWVRCWGWRQPPQTFEAGRPVQPD